MVKTFKQFIIEFDPEGFQGNPNKTWKDYPLTNQFMKGLNKHKHKENEPVFHDYNAVEQSIDDSIASGKHSRPGMSEDLQAHLMGNTMRFTYDQARPTVIKNDKIHHVAFHRLASNRGFSNVLVNHVISHIKEF